VLYLLSIVESTEPIQVYGVKLDFVSERTIKDHHHQAPCFCFPKFSVCDRTPGLGEPTVRQEATCVETKGKNCAVFCFAGKRFFFYIYDVITSPEKEKSPEYYY
jgi:hypothetical protein